MKHTARDYKRWKAQEFYRQVTQQRKRRIDKTTPMSAKLAERVKEALSES